MNNGAALLALTMGAYILGVWAKRKTGLGMLHPMLVAVPVIMAVLKLFHIPTQDYMQANRIITFMLGPCVVSLALVLYDNLSIIRKHMLPILTAVLVGCIVGVGSVWALGELLGLDRVFIASMEPKSITAPIAVELSSNNGGNVALTAASVVICGLSGAVLGPWILNVCRIGNPVARGVAIGSASHGIGTARALEEGALEGAVSGLCLALMGVATTFLLPLFNRIVGF